MTVLSISIIKSKEEIVDGIPRFVSLSTNIPAIIFYTLDGSDPDLYSNQYTSYIEIPQGELLVVLKTFATNGSDTTPIITENYQSVILGKNARLAHSGTDAQPNSVQGVNNPYPFGSSPISTNQIFLGPQEAGITSYNPELPAFSNGFDGAGNPTAFTNQQIIGIPTKTQPIINSETNAIGEPVSNIGTKGKVTIEYPKPPPQYSDSSDKLFDPRALVIFQDFTKQQDPDVPLAINRQFFNLNDPVKESTGNRFFVSDGDLDRPTASFIRQHYNPVDQTITYYYRDSVSNRWIISKTPFTPKPDSGQYYNIVFSNKPGSRFVFQWIPFKGNYLY